MRWRELALNLLGGRVGTVTVTGAGCYIKALEIDPNYATAWISLGFIGGGRVGTVTRSLNHANLARGLVVLRRTQLRMPLLSRRSVQLEEGCSQRWPEPALIQPLGVEAALVQPDGIRLPSSSFLASRLPSFQR